MARPICVNCGDSHPANFKGCKAYKVAIAARSTQKVTVTQRVQQKVKAPAEMVTSARSFVSVACGGTRNVTGPVLMTQQSVSKKEVTLDDIMKLILKLDDRITRMENLQFQSSKSVEKKTRK